MKTLVITGASGLGKTYVGDLLMQLYPQVFDQAKLYTTRLPRGNQKPTDRIFVTQEEFNALNTNGEFVVSGEFGGNMYGFTKEAIYPNGKKHLLVNIWPALLPEFLKLNNIVLIALQTDVNNLSMLEDRMLKRGDDTNTVKSRKKLIVKDISIVNKYINQIKIHGEVFYIQNDSTLHEVVLPWIKKRLGL